MASKLIAFKHILLGLFFSCIAVWKHVKNDLPLRHNSLVQMWTENLMLYLYGFLLNQVFGLFSFLFFFFLLWEDFRFFQRDINAAITHVLEVKYWKSHFVLIWIIFFLKLLKSHPASFVGFLVGFVLAASDVSRNGKSTLSALKTLCYVCQPLKILSFDGFLPSVSSVVGQQHWFQP